MLPIIFSSKARCEILKILFDGTNRELYFLEIVKLANITNGSVQNELKNLLKGDLINSRKDGNRTYFKANSSHPIYLDVVSIVEKTVGIQHLLTECLDEKIKAAFIFGSIASNKAKAQSDIDILLIGDGGMRHASGLFVDLEEKIGREINPHIYTEEDFRKKIKGKNHFICSVLKTKIKVLKGDINDFR